MRLSKTLTFAVNFAAFCAANGLKPYDVALLISLAKHAHSTGERDSNGYASNDKKYAAAQDAFETKAREMGFDVQWPGLWPTLIKGKQEIYLPCD